MKTFFLLENEKNNEYVQICLQNLQLPVFLNFKVIKNVRDTIYDFQTSIEKNKEIKKTLLIQQKRGRKKKEAKKNNTNSDRLH